MKAGQVYYPQQTTFVSVSEEILNDKFGRNTKTKFNAKERSILYCNNFFFFFFLFQPSKGLQTRQ